MLWERLVYTLWQERDPIQGRSIQPFIAPNPWHVANGTIVVKFSAS